MKLLLFTFFIIKKMLGVLGFTLLLALVAPAMMLVLLWEEYEEKSKK